MADDLRQAAALDKTLADEATEQRRANTLKKEFANEAYERHPAATRQKVLANEVNKRRCRVHLGVGHRHGPGPPIYWCPFIVVGDINHERPTNLL